MEEELNKSTRVDFLKKAGLAVASVLGIAIVGFNFRNRQKSPIRILKKLSNSEANNIIRDMKLPDTKSVRPEPPPNTK